MRNIAEVVTAGGQRRPVAQRSRSTSKGEIRGARGDHQHDDRSRLHSFADQVTARGARRWASEGRLGGQAQVPGAAGTWKDLTDNVNLLAANLTTQVRAIAEVATAVTKGDLTRSIQVDARGEVVGRSRTTSTR